MTQPAKLPPWIWAAWWASGLALLGAAAFLTFQSERFSWRLELIDMPALTLAACLCAVGVVFCGVVALIAATVAHGYGSNRRLLALVIGFGIAFRLVLFPSVSAFEDDWYRYLWDGAVTAHGWNPYAVSPDEAQGEAYAKTLQPLAQSSAVIIERVNHSELKTIYPPLAQAAFAIAYALEPWSLRAWREVCLVADLAVLWLLFALLKSVARSPLWAAAYWWNPIVVKELFNSAHMEAIVTPLVLAAVLLAVRRRHVASIAILGLAAGAKLWPLVLTPLLLRPLLNEPRRLAVGVAVLAVLVAAWSLPVIWGGLDATSGFVAYAQYWQNNSAHVRPLTNTLLWLGLTSEAAALLVRAALAAALGCVAFALARRPIDRPGDLIQRAGLTVLALFLLSPVQFPWYLIWVLPFFVFHPWTGVRVATVLLPIYYVSFYFAATDSYAVFTTRVVWLMWLPIWAGFLFDAWSTRREVGLSDADAARHA